MPEGFLARRLGVETHLGVAFDCCADRAFGVASGWAGLGLIALTAAVKLLTALRRRSLAFPHTATLTELHNPFKEGILMKLRIAGLVNDSIVDGPGFRLAVFTQGCPHNCPGCHNPETHDFNGGSDMDTAEIILTMESNPLLDGVTLTGGDPFCQPEACLEVARAAHKLGLNVWAYSGWTYEQLLEDPKKRALLEETDVLVDGPFILAQRTLDKRFMGSKNQRAIDVKASLAQGSAIEIGN